MKKHASWCILICGFLVSSIAFGQGFSNNPRLDPSFPPRSFDELSKLTISAGLYREYFRTLRSLTPSPKAFKTGAFGGKPFVTATTETVTSSTQVVYDDPQQDYETSVLRATTNKTVVGTKNPNGTGDLNYYYTWDGWGTLHVGALPVPGGTYPQSVDPYLAAANNGRTYSIGLLHDTGNNHTAVAVWTMTNPQVPDWTLQSSYVATGQVNTGCDHVSTTLDKPTITVSNYGPQAGYVFAAWMTSTNTFTGCAGRGTKYSIWVARSTDGGVTWDERHEFPAPLNPNNQYQSNLVNMAQVVVSSQTGYVYVAWVDFDQIVDPYGDTTLRRIFFSRSPSAGELNGTWTADNAGPTGHFLNTVYQLNGGVRATTVPVLRYNAAAGFLGVVWHECESVCPTIPATPHTDVYFAAKSAYGWYQKEKINNENDSCNTDQFQPTIDADGNGNIMVTYYDRQMSCANLYFDLYYKHVNAYGQALLYQERPVRATTYLSNPQGYGPNNFIGDYQDIRCDGYENPTWRCFASSVQVPTNPAASGNPYLTTITIQP